MRNRGVRVAIAKGCHDGMNLKERDGETVIEFRKNETQALMDEELENVSGGAEGYWGGTATGVTCTDPACLYAGPHTARQYYDRVDNEITFGRLEVFCGKCGKQLQ